MLLRVGGGALLLIAVLCLIRGLTGDLPFWTSTGVLLLILDIGLLIGYARSAPARRIREVLGRNVSLPVSAGEASTLYGRPFPPRLSWNWAALILGPFWYLIYGLWVHATILLALVLVSGGLLLPLIWLYAALKANEDLREFRIAHMSVY